MSLPYYIVSNQQTQLLNLLDNSTWKVNKCQKEYWNLHNFFWLKLDHMLSNIGKSSGYHIYSYKQPKYYIIKVKPREMYKYES